MNEDNGTGRAAFVFRELICEHIADTPRGRCMPDLPNEWLFTAHCNNRGPVNSVEQSFRLYGVEDGGSLHKVSAFASRRKLRPKNRCRLASRTQEKK